MLKKTITYEDFNGEEVREDFFFHLSKAELVELEFSHKGGLSDSLKNIVATEDGNEIIKEIKNIILKSYGQKSPDGKRFVKNQQLRDEFESSEAYSVLFMELVTDPDASVTFINGIIPAGMAEEVQDQLPGIEESKSTVAEPKWPNPEPEQTPMSGVRPAEEQVRPRTITRRDLVGMTSEEASEITRKIAAGEVELVE